MIWHSRRLGELKEQRVGSPFEAGKQRVRIRLRAAYRSVAHTPAAQGARDTETCRRGGRRDRIGVIGRTISRGKASVHDAL